MKPDLLDGTLYAGDPWPVYSWLRANAPVYRDEANELWGISKYDDVVHVSKHPELFCSSEGFRPKTPPNASMISQDDPRHTRQRRLVYKGFTPKQVAAIEPHVRALVGTLIDSVIERGECDFTQDLAAPLPMILIAEMLGVRVEDRKQLQNWSDELIQGADGHVTEGVMQAFVEFCTYIGEVIEDRRTTPRDDLVSTLVHAVIEGHDGPETLADDELYDELLLVLVGGNETTRNVISGGMEALIDERDQLEAFRDDSSLMPDAVEEMIRWVTPIVNFRRTVTTDTTMRGVEPAAGDQLLLLYGSANRDEDVFVEPDRFDIARHPNPHVSFGFGTHFCLGASLARLEIKVFFEEWLRRATSIDLAPGAAVVRTPSAFIRGIHSMPIVFKNELIPLGLLDGKVCIVTGAGHGIGRGHALELAKHGARVVVNDLGGSVAGEGAGHDADLTTKLIEQRGGEAVANYGDVADDEQAGALIAQAVETWGHLDVLVNNAGIVRDGVVWNMSVDDFDAVMRVHVRGTWLPCHHASVYWRERSKAGEAFTGRIINTVSGAGLVGNFGQTNYATAKAAIAGMTQTLSLELYKMGVTANAVGPAAATRITATMPNAPQVIEADDIGDDEWNPMDPSVSSPLVAWLASDESQLVTGQVIRAVAERIILMDGWADGPTITNGGKRWDATKLGMQLATDVFKTRAPGLRY